MTGYLYQCELALLELAERSWDDITVEVRMEVLDDIEFLYQDSSDPFVLLQSKHRERAGRLSETGKDFWRSVASWIDALTVLGRLSDGTMPLLRLATTQVAAEGTFLHKLRPGPARSVDDALAGMETVAKAAEPGNIADDRKKFTDLTPAQRYRLVAAMEISDASPLMSDLDSRLARALGIRPGQHARAILDDIKGWWYGMAVELLDKNRARASVTAQELQCRLEETLDRFTGKNLPITETLRRLTQAEIMAYKNDLVVAQMQWIGLKDRTIASHLRDYHYARAQRSAWLRDFTITEQALGDYERLLWDEWDHVFTRHTDAVEDDTTAAERKAVGKRVLDDSMDKAAGIPARPGSTTESWIGRGTLHSLAGRAHSAEDDESVGWHPDYPDLCRNHNEQLGQ
ncbi:ABC-three component system protein [Streptomyces ossamyceticus]|uniref:ABC-three component system protein n=1 Tax=Streptomyces ossamyceticus TaxID=249581 RepID=UPI0006E1FA40|nr:ABC-three component system protein [Streptomyces ossamyceticus]